MVVSRDVDREGLDRICHLGFGGSHLSRVLIVTGARSSNRSSNRSSRSGSSRSGSLSLNSSAYSSCGRSGRSSRFSSGPRWRRGNLLLFALGRRSRRKLLLGRLLLRLQRGDSVLGRSSGSGRGRAGRGRAGRCTTVRSTKDSRRSLAEGRSRRAWVRVVAAGLIIFGSKATVTGGRSRRLCATGAKHLAQVRRHSCSEGEKGDGRKMTTRSNQSGKQPTRTRCDALNEPMGVGVLEEKAGKQGPHALVEKFQTGIDGSERKANARSFALLCLSSNLEFCEGCEYQSSWNQCDVTVVKRKFVCSSG